jgi:hypothetical protein
VGGPAHHLCSPGAVKCADLRSRVRLRTYADASCFLTLKRSLVRSQYRPPAHVRRPEPVRRDALHAVSMWLGRESYVTTLTIYADFISDDEGGKAIPLARPAAGSSSLHVTRRSVVPLRSRTWSLFRPGVPGLPGMTVPSAPEVTRNPIPLIWIFLSGPSRDHSGRKGLTLTRCTRAMIFHSPHRG